MIIVSCSRESNEAIPAQVIEPRIVREPAELVPVGHLEGEITILVAQSFVPELGLFIQDNDLRFYARLFNEIHPDVVFNFDTYDMVVDMSQQIALITRLMANPPDILSFNPNDALFEKTEKGTLFFDLNDFIYGSRGINKDDYFSNIFYALETQGGLYHMPIYVTENMVFLNKRLFAAADIDIMQIESFSIDDEIYYFNRIAEHFPLFNVRPSSRFSLMEVLMREQMYDLASGDVFINNQTVYNRLEQALNVPMPRFMSHFSGLTTFTPSRFNKVVTAFNPSHANEMFLTPNHLMSWSSIDGSLASAILLMLSDHPNMQFSDPVNAQVLGNDFGFTQGSARSIMRDSRNFDLAWEFLRFIMEFEDSLYMPFSMSYVENISMPINRIRFEQQVYDYLVHLYDDVMIFTTLGQHIDIPREEHKITTIANIMSHYRDVMESLNYAITVSTPIMQSLVYPDIWLLHSEQQDIATTLANIQNRLELYVAE